MSQVNLFTQSFAKDRTEDDILCQKPIELMLGGVVYPAKPLAIRPGKVWRDKVAGVLNDLNTGQLNEPVTNVASFMQGLLVVFFGFPDKVLELLIAYAPNLADKRELLMDTATDEEVVIAFSRVMAVAYPFFNLLATMRTAALATSQATSQR